MDWTQVMTILCGNLVLFLWTVRLSRADYLHLDRKLEENRRETYSIIKAIQDQMKDFNSKLLRIEAERK